MSHHEEHNEDFLLYLDNALTGERLREFRVHLAGCAECKDRVEQERALSLLLRETRPLYVASASLRERCVVARELAAAPAVQVAERSRQNVFESWRRWLSGFANGGLRWKPAVAVVLAFVLCFLFVPEAVQRARATEYVDAATEIHKNYLSGALPLQCISQSPDEVTEWFVGKTPFHFRLPASQSPPPGRASYWLEGARLVTYKGSPAALVAYTMGAEKITLLAVSANSTSVAGGQEVRSGQLTFHYRHGANFAVTTWTNHGLTYALVSSSGTSAQHPCLVCHQDMADHVVFESVQ